MLDALAVTKSPTPPTSFDVAEDPSRWQSAIGRTCPPPPTSSDRPGGNAAGRSGGDVSKGPGRWPPSLRVPVDLPLVDSWPFPFADCRSISLFIVHSGPVSGLNCTTCSPDGVPPQSRRGDSRRERRRKLAVHTTIEDQVSYPAVYVGELKAARAIAVTADLVRARQEGWDGIRLHKWPGHFRNAATLCERSRSSLIWAGSGMTQTRLAGMIQPISPRISGV